MIEVKVCLYVNQLLLKSLSSAIFQSQNWSDVFMNKIWLSLRWLKFNIYVHYKYVIIYIYMCVYIQQNMVQNLDIQSDPQS